MISVVVPAHNESSVLVRTLKVMTKGALIRELDIIVVCNGCTDDTAKLARDFGQPVRVIETAIGSKTYALNLGDRAAQCFPRFYVDADVVVSIHAIRFMADRLRRGDVLAVAPTPHIDLTGCSWPVRAAFDIRSRLPSSREGIGGSGVYALSEAGHNRIREFPELTADDGYVRLQFRSDERETLTSITSTVFPPRTIKDLVATKTRSHYGSFQLAQRFPELWKNRGKSNDADLIGLFKCPWLWHKLLIYCYVTITAKHQAKSRLLAGSFSWQRDESSRVAAR